MKQQRILVISSANIDFVMRMHRMPYSGETVVERDMKYYYIPGGRGTNCAVAFSRIGADCVFTCKVGSDPNAKRIFALLRDEGIDTRYVLEDEYFPTGMSSIMVEENGNNRMVVYSGANLALRSDEIEESFTCYPDAVFIQFEIPDDAILEAAHRAAVEGLPLFIDAGPAKYNFPLGQLGHVEIFTLNETETRIFTGINPSCEEYCLRAAIKLSGMVDAKYIVIKLGERGSFVYDGHEFYNIPAEDVHAVDTTGAGDVFSAVMTYVYLQNGNILSAVKYATCAAALSVQKEGAVPSIPTLSEIVGYIHNKLTPGEE